MPPADATPSSPRWWSEPPTPRFLYASAAVCVGVHVLLWIVCAVLKHMGPAVVLNHEDSIYYSTIIKDGYAGRNFAFFPLFPAIVRALWVAVDRSVLPQFLGTAVSTACFAVFTWLTARWQKLPELAGLVPATRFDWLVLLIWPASYVFHSHHTEALFLLLSFVAFARARQGHAIEAPIYAGLASLCRNQGVLVAVAVAYELASRAPAGRKALRFVIAGALSLAIFAALPLYDWSMTGDALAFYHAQRDWTQAHSVWELVRVFWLGNPWQRKAFGGIVHNLVWLGCIVVAIQTRARSMTLAVYVLASLAIIIFQGELVMTFRFVAVLFPFLYALAAWATDRGRCAQYGVVAALLVLALQTTWKYASGGHAY